MHLAVGDHDGSGNPVARDIGHQAFEGGHKVCPAGLRVGLDQPNFERGVGVEVFAQLLKGGVGDLAALAEGHAFRPVDDNGGYRWQRFPFLTDIGRVGEGRGQAGERCRPRKPCLAPPVQIGPIGQHTERQKGPERRPPQERVKAYASGLRQRGPPSGLVSSRLSRSGRRAGSPSPSPRRSSRAGR